ncbi:MAG: universal stress protein [Alphaproteobacteria bacterium]|nr:universal stress protein [Alphaproteobacteria bacterium]
MFKSILVPVDVAHRSSWQFALPQAIELAGRSSGMVTVMTVVRDVQSILAGVQMGYQLDRAIAGAESALERIVADCRADGVAIGRRVVAGSIGQGILETAAELGCDLILMASHRPEMRDYLIGPNAAHVAMHAPISVLVLRRFE